MSEASQRGFAGPVGEDPEFITRLATALERIESGEPPDLEGLCADRPALREPLEAALRDATALSGLNAAAAGFDPRIGARLGERYELRARLGAGGMGVVYEAFDHELERLVAVKMMRAEFTAGAAAAARFEREALVLAGIDNPAIIPVYDHGRGPEGQAYLVLPRLQGCTAAELIEDPPAASTPGAFVTGTEWFGARLQDGSDQPPVEFEPSYVRQVVRWIMQIAAALEPLHRDGIVHRDIKPSNIFVRRDGVPILIDFGLVSCSAESSLSQGDGPLGTPAYLAPEQLDPRAQARATTDVYGLTASLYTLLTFARPYPGSASQVLAALQRRDPTPAVHLRPGLPRDLQAILDKGMARDPAQRYASAAALAADLQAWLDYRPVQARPIGPLTRGWRRWRRTAALRAAVGTAALGLVLVLGSAVLQHRAAQREARHLEAFNGFAPVLVIGLPGLRVSPDPAAERRLAERLDQMVAHAPEPCPAHLLRAAFRLDRGQRQAAVADMVVIAEHYATPISRRLVELYRASEDAKIEVEDLQPGDSVVDRLLIAFHLSRTADVDEAAVAALLSGRTDVFAAELAIHAEVGRCLAIPSSATRREALEEVLDRANRLEGLRGAPSAFLARSKGLIASNLARFAAARDQFRVALGLTEQDYTIWHNLALAIQRLGDDQAGIREALRRAIALQPKSMGLHALLVEVELEAKDFAAAEACIEDAPFPADAAGTRREKQLRGHLALARAEELFGADEPSPQDLQRSRELAADAHRLFAEARPPGVEEWSFLMLLSKCLEEPESDLKENLFVFARRDPLNPDYLTSIYLLYRNQLEDPTSRHLLDLCRGVLRSLIPGKFDKPREPK